MLLVNPGLQPERLATIAMGAPRSFYDADANVIALARRVMDRIARLPGFAEVSTEYFHTIGVRLLDGRYFTESDYGTKPKVVIVIQALATKDFPGESAIGKQVTDLRTPPAVSKIVGVVEDIKERPLNEATPPTTCQPFLQEPNSRFVVIYTARQSEESVIGSLSAAIKEIDPTIVTLPAETMRSDIANSVAFYLNRSSATLAAVAATVAGEAMAASYLPARRAASINPVESLRAE